MGRSQAIGLRDVRQVFRIIGECRELGASPVAWQQHLYEGMFRLTGAQVGIGGGAVFDAGFLRPLPELMIDLGWETPTHRQTFRRYVGSDAFREDPCARAMVRRWRAREPVMTRLRHEVIDDDQWHRSRVFREAHQPSGVDNGLLSLARLPDGGIHGMTLHRPAGAGPFELRHRRLLHLAHAEAARLIGCSLASPGPDPLATLTPRLRQVLRCLLGGDAEKQVALRLGLAQHTVHQYVKELHRRFGVSSRAELLARFVSRPMLDALENE